MQYFIRFIIACVVGFLIFLLIPLTIDLIDLPVPSALVGILKICVIAVGFFYVLRGPDWPRLTV